MDFSLTSNVRAIFEKFIASKSMYLRLMCDVKQYFYFQWIFFRPIPVAVIVSLFNRCHHVCACVCMFETFCFIILLYMIFCSSTCVTCVFICDCCCCRCRVHSDLYFGHLRNSDRMIQDEGD